MDDEYEYSISDHAEPLKPIMCVECGVTLSESDLSRHTILCDQNKREYEKKLKEKAEAAALERMLDKLLK